MKGHLIIKSVHFQHLCLRTVSFTHSLLVQPVHRNYTSCSFPVCQSSYIPMALLQLTGAFDTIQELLPVCQPIYQCVQHNDLSLLLNPLAHLIQQCTLLNDQYKPFSGLPSDALACPCHLIQVYPMISAYHALSHLYTLFRCSQWLESTTHLLVSIIKPCRPYSDLPIDQYGHWIAFASKPCTPYSGVLCMLSRFLFRIEY